MSAETVREGEHMATSIGRRHLRRFGILGAVAALAMYLIVTAIPASAAVSCGVSGSTPNQTLTITLNAADTTTLTATATNITVSSCVGPFLRADVSAIVVNADTLAEVENQHVIIDGTNDFTASISLNLGAGDDTVDVSNTSGADPITADLAEGGDTYNGGGGSVSGDVTVNGGTGDDTIDTGGGNDTVDAGDGSNAVDGGPGADAITSGSGVDTLTGQAGRDNIAAGAGSDVIDAGDGSDTVAPGAGDDGTNVSPVEGGPGRDTISFADAAAEVDVDLTDGIALVGATEEDTIANFENVVGSAQGDKVRGTPSNNDIAGGKGSDSVRASGGDDDVHGGAGPDTLRGGDGDDDLFGQGGPDHLFGGAGTDLCKGGKGRDTKKGCE